MICVRLFAFCSPPNIRYNDKSTKMTKRSNRLKEDDRKKNSRVDGNDGRGDDGGGARHHRQKMFGTVNELVIFCDIHK